MVAQNQTNAINAITTDTAVALSPKRNALATKKAPLLVGKIGGNGVEFLHNNNRGQ